MPGMKTISDIATAAGLKQGTLSNIIAERRRPSWKAAKRLARITGTKPELWLEGTEKEMRAALNLKN